MKVSLLKKRIDDEKIRSLNRSGHHHPYVYEEWVDWTGNNYIKSYYDVLLPDGEILTHCWPNAGMLNASNGMKLKANSGVKARLSSTNRL